MDDEATTELATTTKPEMTPEVLPMSEDIVVLARDPEEMALAQKGLIAWMSQKIGTLKADLAEAEENLATAKRMKTRTEGWQRVVRLAQGRVTYYEKALAALEEGFCIVPDLPVELIAIRTCKEHPSGKWHTGRSFVELSPDMLPKGEGEYVSPTPVTEQRDVPIEGRTYPRKDTRAVDFQEVDFPFKVVKPQILQGLEHAMRLKLFDEIGVLPRAHRNADPLLVGRIKRREGYNERAMTFLIAWWIDTRSL